MIDAAGHGAAGMASRTMSHRNVTGFREINVPRCNVVPNGQSRQWMVLPSAAGERLYCMEISPRVFLSGFTTITYSRFNGLAA